jgi:hypothetical protein
VLRWGEAERQLVLRLRRDNPTYGKEKLVIILKRDHNSTISESIVGRILKDLFARGLIQKSASALRRKRKRNFKKGKIMKYTFCLLAFTLFVFTACADEIDFAHKISKTNFVQTIPAAHPSDLDKYWEFYQSQSIETFQAKLSKDGELTPTAIEYWLFHEGILVPRFFFDTKGKLAHGAVKRLQIRRSGLSSSAIFNICFNGKNEPRYTIKVYKDNMYKRELTVEKQAELAKQVAKSNYPHLHEQDAKFPRITNFKWVGHYKNQKQQRIYLSVIDQARGTPLDTLLADAINKQDRKSLDLLQHVFGLFGQAIGALHAEHLVNSRAAPKDMQSYGIHGDLNATNVYYDKIDGITLIDNETLGLRIDAPLSISKEYNLLFHVGLHIEFVFHNPKIREKLFNIQKSFVNQYAAAFGAKSDAIRSYLIEYLLNIFSDPENTPMLSMLQAQPAIHAAYKRDRSEILDMLHKVFNIKKKKPKKKKDVTKADVEDLMRQCEKMFKEVGINEPSLFDHFDSPPRQYMPETQEETRESLLPGFDFTTKQSRDIFYASLPKKWSFRSKGRFWDYYKNQTLEGFAQRLSPTGDMTVEALTYWLFHEGKYLDRSKFSKEDDVLMAPVVEKEFDLKSAKYTQKLFVILDEEEGKPINLFKVHDTFTLSNLHYESQLTPLMDLALQQKLEDARTCDFPEIIFPDWIGQYTTNAGNRFYCSIQRHALGRSFDNMRPFYTNPGMSKSQHAKNITMFGRLGSNIGALHAAFVTTEKSEFVDQFEHSAILAVHGQDRYNLQFERHYKGTHYYSNGVHGDVDAKNMFYDEESGFTFIDNDTLTDSLKCPSSVINDYEVLFLNVLMPQLGLSPDMKFDIFEYSKIFIESYAAQFGDLENDIKNYLTEYLAYYLKHHFVVKSIAKTHDISSKQVDKVIARYRATLAESKVTINDFRAEHRLLSKVIQ